MQAIVTCILRSIVSAVAFLCPWFPGHLLLSLLGGDSLQVNVNKLKCYKLILQSSVLVILTS